MERKHSFLDLSCTRFLIIDDDDTFRTVLMRVLQRRGYETHGIRRGVETALEEVATHQITHVVLDLKMPGTFGIDVLRAFQSLHAPPKTIILTGYGSIATATEAMRYGAIHYLTKPADVDNILAAFMGENSPIETLPPLPVPTLARVEWEHIQRILRMCGGNISSAARYLGIHRRSLQRKLNKYPVLQEYSHGKGGST
ncbi:response regulator transcription factor [Pajaroellobacter abortibovis]|uniref:Response regulatory domain-containing protein n=1 Tax=Pajaroellobacter abortibovis TaxID=1882918 RepID=A0A1L6MWJ3_9BACT|nr:response regulator [Pajaroellobacter abortibovis]APR99903.1 hypothetical protein BCY86_03820 [Pajaroellobacter abortibovis]